MSNNTRQDNIDRGSYIPPQIGQAMDRHMQQTLPAHLRQYVGPNKPAYIPKGVEKQISQQMDRTMPGHLKSYNNAYVQQRIVQPNSYPQSGQSAIHPPIITPNAPLPNQVRSDHSLGFGEQHTVDFNPIPITSQTSHAGNTPFPAITQPTVASQPTQLEDPNRNGYDFIMKPKNSLNNGFSIPSLPGLGPKLSKVVFALFGLLILILLVHGIIGALSAPTNIPTLISVAQDQVELVHLSTNASTKDPDISLSNQNYVVTTKLSMTSSNTALVDYLILNRHKYSPKILSLKVKLSTDTALATSEAAGTFNQDFIQTNTQLLNSYIGDINTAYNLTKGLKGRALLTNDYNQAQLLLVQLNSTSSN